MPYYDRCAAAWHRATGHNGGAFKEFVLNELLLSRLPGIGGSAILELGAGNGYFMPMLLRRRSGQVPGRIVITDVSKRSLEIVQRHFRVPRAEYRVLDVRQPFLFADEAFDLILATMVFNEVPSPGFEGALSECGRVLRRDGTFLMTVMHPAFVDSLWRRGELRRAPHGPLTMPGHDGLRLPVVRRAIEAYESALEQAGFRFSAEDVHASPQVLNAKPGLRKSGGVPLARVYTCTRPQDVSRSFCG